MMQWLGMCNIGQALKKFSKANYYYYSLERCASMSTVSSTVSPMSTSVGAWY